MRLDKRLRACVHFRAYRLTVTNKTWNLFRAEPRGHPKFSLMCHLPPLTRVLPFDLSCLPGSPTQRPMLPLISLKADEAHMK